MKVLIYAANPSEHYTQKIVDVCESQRYNYEIVIANASDIPDIIPDDVTPHVYIMNDGFGEYIGRAIDFMNHVQRKENINA